MSAQETIGRMSNVDALGGAILLAMAWDRLLSILRLWSEKKISDHDALDALVREIVESNKTLNDRLGSPTPPIQGGRP